jgi:hypothetical protein
LRRQFARPPCGGSLPGLLAEAVCPASLRGQFARPPCGGSLPGLLAGAVCPASLRRPGACCRRAFGKSPAPASWRQGPGPVGRSGNARRSAVHAGAPAPRGVRIPRNATPARTARPPPCAHRPPPRGPRGRCQGQHRAGVVRLFRVVSQPGRIGAPRWRSHERAQRGTVQRDPPRRRDRVLDRQARQLMPETNPATLFDQHARGKALIEVTQVPLGKRFKKRRFDGGGHDRDGFVQPTALRTGAQCPGQHRVAYRRRDRDRDRDRGAGRAARSAPRA